MTTSHLEDPFSVSLRTLIPLLFGLVDDAVVVGLSRLGCTVPVLKVLSPLILSGTVFYVLVQLYSHGWPALKTYWRKALS
ncbi:MAG: hypothetical protein NZL92_06025 [Gloeomargarita sp. SKYG116]|nr:hypothetical protein [Gloeomargarita sp. SKYG116]MCS7226073.1 hypothetical protein [Gloeomargarita sp. SKYB31]MDW8401236.1 hypothetical protein [Gloeomargarita sp. SKYGB_i_bin116]